jgi:hypothetical protein
MAVTMKNVVFGDMKTQFVPHRKHITSPLQSPAVQCYVRCEVFMAVTMRNAVLLDVTPWGYYKNRRLGGTYRFYQQGDKNRRARNWYVPLKHRFLQELHGITSQKTTFFFAVLFFLLLSILRAEFIFISLPLPCVHLFALCPLPLPLCGQLPCPTALRWMTQGACVTARVNWEPSPCWICKVPLLPRRTRRGRQLAVRITTSSRRWSVWTDYGHLYSACSSSAAP